MYKVYISTSIAGIFFKTNNTSMQLVKLYNWNIFVEDRAKELRSGERGVDDCQVYYLGDLWIYLKEGEYGWLVVIKVVGRR